MLVLRWRVPAPPIATRWRGPAGTLASIARAPASPVAAVIGTPGRDAGMIEREAAAAIQPGQAVRPDNAGKLLPAQADSLANARQVAIASLAAAAGHSCTARSDFVTLADWTAATGAHALVPGAEYFLSAAAPGALVISPAATGVVLSVGIAIDAATLAINPGQPILL